VHIHPAFSLKHIPLVGTLLGIVPVYLRGIGIEIMFLIIVCPGANRIAHIVQLGLDEPQRLLCGNQEFQVVMVQVVNVGLAVESPVHDQFDLVVPQKIDVGQKVLHGLHIGDISRKLSVIKRKVGFFPEQHCKINLGKRVMVFVHPVSDLL